MDLVTISQVSKMFNVSTRMLRYYEEIGILPSLKVEDYAYRVYNEESVLRLKQIIILRKLRIPLKHIKMIFDNQNTDTLLKVFMQNISEVDNEITALSTMRIILNNFIEEIQKNSDIPLKSILFSDEIMLNAIDSLSLTKINFKEERSMDELNKANEELSKLKDVRIVHLPACTVASSHYIGENPESNAGDMLYDFVKKSNLYNIKPDARVFGFNHPNPSEERSEYGYELWVTIPDDMEVPAPLEKKHFNGGMYAAHMISAGNFHEWEWLVKWVVEDNPKYTNNDIPDGGECMGGLMEEHLNYIHYAKLDWPKDNDNQLDLLFPIKLK